MIPSSILARSLAFAVSATTVLGVVHATSRAPEAQVEASGALVQTRLGNSFRDLAVGTERVDTTSEAAPAPPEQIAATVPEASETTTALEPSLAPRLAAQAMPTLSPTSTAQSSASALQPDPSRTPSATIVASNAAPATAALAITPKLVPTVAPSLTQTAQPAPVTSPTSAAQAQTSETRTPIVAAPVPSTKKADVIEPDTAAPLLSERPKLRDPSKAPRPKAVPKLREQVAKKTPAQTRGNAQQRKIAGAATAQSQTAKPVKQGNAGRKAQPGNAKVSNYPGRIIRCVKRARQPSAKGRGKVVVNFSVAANGALRKIRVVKSSGIPALDQSAISTVRGASPCPAPPTGANRNFNITILGR